MTTADCPYCGKSARLDAANKYRPFCSERCRLIDLGAWVDEEHKIAGREFNDPGFDGDTYGAANASSAKH